MKYNRDDESRWSKPFLECEKVGNYINKSLITLVDLGQRTLKKA